MTRSALGIYLASVIYWHQCHLGCPTYHSVLAFIPKICGSFCWSKLSLCPIKNHKLFFWGNHRDMLRIRIREQWQKLPLSEHERLIKIPYVQTNLKVLGPRRVPFPTKNAARFFVRVRTWKHTQHWPGFGVVLSKTVWKCPELKFVGVLMAMGFLHARSARRFCLWSYKWHRLETRKRDISLPEKNWKHCPRFPLNNSTRMANYFSWKHNGFHGSILKSWKVYIFQCLLSKKTLNIHHECYVSCAEKKINRRRGDTFMDGMFSEWSIFIHVDQMEETPLNLWQYSWQSYKITCI